MTRKLIVSEFMALDGVMENPQWTFPYGSEEQERFKYEELRNADALLLGRVTYEGFAAASPNMLEQTGEYGQWMNGYPKYVVSNSLSELGWTHSTLLQGDLQAEIAKLKALPGKDILVFGSCTLVQSLIKLGQVDEYRLMVFPLLAGGGKRLFGDSLPKTALKLTETKRFSSGVVVATYVPADE